MVRNCTFQPFHDWTLPILPILPPRSLTRQDVKCFLVSYGVTNVGGSICDTCIFLIFVYYIRKSPSFQGDDIGVVKTHRSKLRKKITQSWCSVNKLGFYQYTRPKKGHPSKVGIGQRDEHWAILVPRSFCKPNVLTELDALARSYIIERGVASCSSVGSTCNSCSEFQYSQPYRTKEIPNVTIKSIVTQIVILLGWNRW